MWTFYLPTKIIFGRGTSGTINAMPEIEGRRCVVVTDPTIAKLPGIHDIIERLAPAAVFDGVQPNPTVENTDALTDVLKKSNAEMILAIGGGSPLDCAKAASCLAKTDDRSIRRYHSEGKMFSIGNIPVITVPTTAGTGSEVTPISVLDDKEKNFKGPITSPLFHPVCAVVDPDLTISVPLFITAATAFDALSHSIECYWSKNHQPICDALAKDAAKTIFVNLPKVYETPDDPETRERLSYAALIAGIAFQMPKNAIMHACSYPLSSRAHMSHGAACAFTMEASIQLNSPHMNGRMEEFAHACGFSEIEDMIDEITKLKRQGGLPCTLNEAGILPEMVETLIKESFHPAIKNNPKEVTEDDLHTIYRKLND